jgi:hypothetical protein
VAGVNIPTAPDPARPLVGPTRYGAVIEIIVGPLRELEHDPIENWGGESLR